MMCRLLQNFDQINFDGDAQPPFSRPPEEWKTRPGRERVEKVRPKVLITLFAMVRSSILSTEAHQTDVIVGRSLGSYA